MLVEEGKLRWDDRSSIYLPWFQLSDPVRHARDDRARPAGASQRARAWRRRPAVVAGLDLQPRRRSRAGCAIMPLATSFRSAYAYDNVLYLVAGEVIEAVSGQSWEDFVRQPDPREGRHDVEQRAALGGDARRERRDAARARRRHACARSRRSTATTPIRPAESIRAPTTWRSGCSCSSSEGQLADGSRAVLAGDGAAIDDDRDADSDRRRRAGAARAQTELQRLRARLRHPRLSRPQAASRIPAGCLATSRRSR